MFKNFYSGPNKIWGNTKIGRFPRMPAKATGLVKHTPNAKQDCFPSLGQIPRKTNSSEKILVAQIGLNSSICHQPRCKTAGFANDETLKQLHCMAFEIIT